MGGPIITAGGLVFIGAAVDNYLRAFDVETGESCRKVNYPLVYRPHGRQFIVIAAGSHHPLPSANGDSLIAFAYRE
jgi:quinoprotein glucose dehydrogenase